MNKYIILPSCDEKNKGDQALLFETIRLAKDSGCIGEYYVVGELNNLNTDSKKYISLSPILRHPSTRYKNNDYINYNLTVKIKWGIVAFLDLIKSLLQLLFLNSRIENIFVDKVTLNTIKTFKDASAFFVKGGGFIHSEGGFTSLYKMYFFLYHIIIAKRMKKKVIFMPNSFGPFNGPFVKKFIKKVLSKCDIIMCRESISQNMLEKECNISSYLYPDLGFFLESQKYSDINKYLQQENNVAITVRPYRFNNQEDWKFLYTEYKKSFVKFIIWLKENGYNPVLVEQVYSDVRHEQDNFCIMEIVEMLNEKNISISVIRTKNLSCKVVKYIYSMFDYTVGTRFHSVIFSLSSNVPSIAITYGGNKGQGIMKDIGLSEYAIPINEINFIKLKESFERLELNRDSIFLTLNDVLIAQQRKRHLMIDLIREELL